MNAPPDSPLLALLRQVQRRLWSERILFRLLRATWWSATLLLGGGLVHVLRQPIPWPCIAALALLPLATAVLLGLWRDRPTLLDTANTADHWFDGKALMASALDQLRVSQRQRTCASRFVIEAANRSAPRWLERLEHEHRWRPPRHAFIPVALGLAGTYLLLLPGPAPREDTAAIAATPSPAGTSRRDNTASDFVAGLREALHVARQGHTDPAVMAAGAKPTGKQSGTDKFDRFRPGGTETAPLPTTPLDTAAPVSHEGEATLSTDIRPGTADPEGRVSDTAGSLAGRAANALDGHPATPPLIVTFFPLDREEGGKDGGLAAGRGASRELAPMPAALVPVENPQTARAARWDTNMPYALSLSTAQRHYVQQYFSDLGEPR